MLFGDTFVNLNNIAQEDWWDYFYPILIFGIIIILTLIQIIVFVYLVKKEHLVEDKKSVIGKRLLTIGFSFISIHYLLYLIFDLLRIIVNESHGTISIDYINIINTYARYSFIQLGIALIFSFVGYSYIASNSLEKSQQKKLVLSYLPLGVYFIYEFCFRAILYDYGYLVFFDLTFNLETILPFVLLLVFLAIFIFNYNYTDLKDRKRRSIVIPIASIVIYLLFTLLAIFGTLFMPSIYEYFRWNIIYEMIILIDFLFLLIYSMVLLNQYKIPKAILEITQDFPKIKDNED
ncbi:MAG: hypothetical protein FK734_08595 [Asgard group archaeon]|nr:hypothetical protein [Asgard group archaeon]